MAMQEGLKRFGWQGIGVDVPVEWELHRHSGDEKAGYAALDDGEEMRLQVRWTQAGRGGAAVTKTVARYGKSLSKACRGHIEFESYDASYVPKKLRQGRKMEAFRWETDRVAYGLAWHCAASGRVVLMEVLFEGNAKDRRGAHRILRSAMKGGQDEGRLWSVYGFAFQTPASYNLERPDLAPGRLRFLFRESRRSWLRVERWAVASQWRGKATLEQWPGELLKVMGATPRGEMALAQTQVGGHVACRFGQAVGRKGWARRERIEGVVWVCAEEDKVLAVLCAGAEDEDAPERVARTVVCA